MKKIDKGDVLILLVSLAFLVVAIKVWDYLIEFEKSKVRKGLEEAYFKGQKDYALGDKRIGCSKDSVWV